MVNSHSLTKSKMAPVILVCILVGYPTVHARMDNPRASRPHEDSTLLSLVQDDLEFLKEETVSIASHYEQPISEAPGNVYVITEEDIRHSGAIDLPTILRRIPGMEVMQTTAADFNVSIRGDNQLLANKLLVLIDGRSIYLDAQGVVFWKSIPVTIPEIKRIEVIKGPASAIYGFNAFDGVINIITKSPQDLDGMTAQVAGGEFDTLMASAIYAEKYENFGYRLSYGFDQTNRWDKRDALAFRSNKFNLQTVYDLTSSARLKLSGGLVDTGRLAFQSVDANFLRYADFLQGYVFGGYESPDFILRANWNITKLPLENSSQPALASVVNPNESSVDNDANTYNIEAQHQIALPAKNRFSYGVNYRLNTFSSDNIRGFSREHRLGLYLQNEWNASSSLTAVAGVRVDLDTFINPTYSPRGSLLWNPLEDHTFRASVSVGYRPPTLFETNAKAGATIAFPPPLGSTTRSTAGNKNLDSERIISYELAYQGWYVMHRLRLRTELFYNQLSDLIEIRPSGPGTTDPSRPSNGGKGKIYGGEASVEFLIYPWLSGIAHAAYQEFDQRFTGLSKRAGPKWKATGGLRGDWEMGLHGEILLHYLSATTWPLSDAFTQLAPLGVTSPNPRVNAYTLLNLQGSYRFWREKAEAGFSVFNALNDKHKQHPLGDTIKSRVLGWLTIRY